MTGAAQGSGSRKKLPHPEDEVGTDNKVRDEEFALVWGIGSSREGFDQKGSMVACPMDDGKQRSDLEKITETGTLHPNHP